MVSRTLWDWHPASWEEDAGEAAWDSSIGCTRPRPKGMKEVFSFQAQPRPKGRVRDGLGGTPLKLFPELTYPSST